MTSNNAIDARVGLLLSAALAGHQADVGRPRPSPHRGASRQRAIAGGKTFDTFDFNAVPTVSKAQIMARRRRQQA